MLNLSHETAQLYTGMVLDDAGANPDETAGRVCLRLEDGTVVWARMALAVPICPAVGDELLVIGQPDRHFVIGVLHAHGPTAIAYPHGLELSTGTGPLRVQNQAAVEIDTPTLNARAGRIEIAAEVMWQRLTHCFQWVRDLMQSRLGRRRTAIETTSVERAGTIITKADDTVKIDAPTIHLG